MYCWREAFSNWNVSGWQRKPTCSSFFSPSVLCFHLCHSSNYWQYWKQLFWRCIKSLFFVIQQVSGIGSSYCSPFDFSLFPCGNFPCWMHVDLAWFPALPAALPNRAVAFENTALLKNKLEQSRLGFQREWKDLDPCCCALQSVIDCKLTHIMEHWRVFGVITGWKSGIWEIMKKPRVSISPQANWCFAYAVFKMA